MHNIQPKTLFVGKNQVYLPSCHSTNEYAAEMIQKFDLIDGTVIFADFQTAGKGQRGNDWESKPAENILMSIILNTSFLPVSSQFQLSICAAVSILELIKPFGETKIKWPNDILLNNKKIAGVLIESSVTNKFLSHTVIGIGINVFQTAFFNTNASSLILENDKFHFDRMDIMKNICEKIENNFLKLKNDDFEEIKNRYLENLFWYKKQGKFKSGDHFFDGEIKGVEENGRINILCNNEMKKFDIKEITFLY